MASITPFVSTSNSSQFTSSQTLQDSTESIAGASLASGIDYLVIYAVAYGANDSAAVVECVVAHGSTVIARGSDESGNLYVGTPRSGHYLCGYHKITGDGSNALKLQFRCVTASDTAYIQASTLIAIPLDDLEENNDYFVSVQNGDVAEASTSSADVEVLSASFTLPEDGDYLVLGSMEGLTPSGGSDDGITMYLQIGGVTQKVPFAREYEDDAASVSFSYARIHTLTSGSKTIRLMGGLAQGTGETYQFRRGRLIVLNMQSFDQYDNDAGLSSDSETEVTTPYTSYTTLLTAAQYDPGSSEYVLVLGNVCARGIRLNYTQLARLRNTTDSTSLCAAISSTCHDTDGVIDVNTFLVAGCEQFTTPGKVYELHGSGTNASAYSAYFSYPDLVILTLATKTGGTVFPRTLTETAVGSAWRAEGGSSYSITFEEDAQGSHSITTPSGPVRYVNGSTGDDSLNGESATVDGGGVGPWRTLQRADDMIATGTTVYIADGIYDGMIILSHNATAANPTRWVGSGSAATITDRYPSATEDKWVEIRNSAHIILDNIVFDGTDFTNVTPANRCIYLYITESVTIQNCTFYNAPMSAIQGGPCPRTKILDNLFDTMGGGTFGTGDHIVYMSSSTNTNPQRGIEIRRNTFRDCFGGSNPDHPEADPDPSNPIQFQPANGDSQDSSNRDSIIDSNIFVDNAYNILSLFSTINCTISNNIWYDDGVNVMNNIVFPRGAVVAPYEGPAPYGNVIVNNTFINRTTNKAPIVFGQNAASDRRVLDNYVFNNIFVRGNSSSFGGLDDGDGDQFISSVNIHKDYTAANLAALFSDPNNNDFTILETSPAHNLGIPAYLGKAAPTNDLAGVTRPQGSFFDIGAYEIYHGTGPYSKTALETATGTDTKSGNKWMSRDLPETAISSQTMNRVGTIFARVLSETARGVYALRGWWGSTTDYVEEIITETARGAATLVRGLVMSHTPTTETATGADTLDRSGTIIARTHTETAIGDDLTIDAALPAPAENTINVVGYVTGGAVGGETG